jgi:hypothetical protein
MPSSDATADLSFETGVLCAQGPITIILSCAAGRNGQKVSGMNILRRFGAADVFRYAALHGQACQVFDKSFPNQLTLRMLASGDVRRPWGMLMLGHLYFRLHTAVQCKGTTGKNKHRPRVPRVGARVPLVVLKSLEPSKKVQNAGIDGFPSKSVE